MLSEKTILSGDKQNGNAGKINFASSDKIFNGQELENIFIVLADLAIDSYLDGKRNGGLERPILPA